MITQLSVHQGYWKCASRWRHEEIRVQFELDSVGIAIYISGIQHYVEST